MQKIPTLFERDWDSADKHLTDQFNPECAWVAWGLNLIAHRKYDGTCVMLDENFDWWARREVKEGKQIPPGFKQISIDDGTGRVMGWIPMDQSGYVKHWEEAVDNAGWLESGNFEPGTYELCGPKVGSNPENLDKHMLFSHDIAPAAQIPVPFEYQVLKEWVTYLHDIHGWEGVVIKIDGERGENRKMCKLKYRDFAKEL